MMSREGKSALDILGSPDDLKFRSCLTLFAEAASKDTDRTLFKQALDQFYGGKAISNDGVAALNVVFKYFVLKGRKKTVLVRLRK